MNDQIQKKWSLLEPLIDELEMSRRMDIGRQSAYDDTLEKLSKIKKLKENIDNDEFELKREYLMLMYERNVYLEKLLMIKQLCEETSPQHADAALVELLKPLVEQFRSKLRRESVG